MNQDPFKEYIRESEPNKRAAGSRWAENVKLSD